jgi:DNA-binding NarL/FixJ family response regulator
MRIALIEDGTLTRQRMAKLIGTCFPDSDVTEFSDLASSKAFAATTKQDCWLVDLGLPDGSGTDLIRMVRDLDPNANILVITIFEDVERIIESFRAGANGYLLKNGSDIDLIGAINTIESGGTPLSPTIARKVMERAMTESASPAAHRKQVLAERELELLNFFARGFSYIEVAQRMGVTLSTIQTQVRRIYAKLAVNSRAEALFEARALGLLPA